MSKSDALLNYCNPKKFCHALRMHSLHASGQGGRGMEVLPAKGRSQLPASRPIQRHRVFALQQTFVQ